MGAVQAVTPEEHEQYVQEALNAAARQLYSGFSIDVVNDGAGHTATLKCFDQAIKDAS
jgi:hypothetical protein